MTKYNIPNTRIKIGELKASDLEKISYAYLDCGLEICGKTLLEHTSVNSINEENKKLRDFEITPQPFGRVGSKLYFSPRNCVNGDFYINIKINPDDYAIDNIGTPEEIQKKFNKNLIEYLIYKK